MIAVSMLKSSARSYLKISSLSSSFIIRINAVEICPKFCCLSPASCIVTIIGILLSVALICAVAGMVTSFQATLVNIAITDGGNRHLTVENVSKEDLKYFTNNSHVKSIYLTETLGYAKYDNMNEYNPYAYIL